MSEVSFDRTFFILSRVDFFTCPQFFEQLQSIFVSEQSWHNNEWHRLLEWSKFITEQLEVISHMEQLLFVRNEPRDEIINISSLQILGQSFFMKAFNLFEIVSSGTKIHFIKENS